MPEQRRNRRFDLRLPIEMIRAVNRQTRITGETQNISSSGVLFCSEAPAEPGESIEYYITLPTAPSPAERLRLHCVGKVIRVFENADLDSGRHTVAATMERYEFTRQRVVANSPLSK